MTEPSQEAMEQSRRSKVEEVLKEFEAKLRVEYEGEIERGKRGMAVRHVEVDDGHGNMSWQPTGETWADALWEARKGEGARRKEGKEALARLKEAEGEIERLKEEASERGGSALWPAASASELPRSRRGQDE